MPRAFFPRTLNDIFPAVIYLIFYFVIPFPVPQGKPAPLTPTWNIEFSFNITVNFPLTCQNPQTLLCTKLQPSTWYSMTCIGLFWILDDSLNWSYWVSLYGAGVPLGRVNMEIGLYLFIPFIAPSGPPIFCLDGFSGTSFEDRFSTR